MDGNSQFNPGDRGTVDIGFANRGSGNAGRFDYKVYLSTNSRITSSDTELALSGLGSGSLSGGLRAGRSDSENNVGFTLPSDLGSGNYYIGVLADTDRDVSESNENNNSDSERITVTAPTPSLPDIVISSFSVDGNSQFNPGDRGTVDIGFANRGSGNAGRFDYKVYLSTNSRITSSDTELALSGLGSGSLSGGLRAGRSDSENNVGFTLPSDLGSGNYYIGVLADTDRDVSESNENNNSDSERITVTAPTPSLPDIVISSFSVDGNSQFNPGDRGTVDIGFANRGSGNAGRFDYKVYLSTNSSITSSDTELALSGLGSGSLSGGLRAGRSDSENNVGFTLPSDLGSGNYYIGVLADTDRDVSESNENNNSDSERITVTAPTPSLPDIVISSFSVDGNNQFNPGDRGTVDIGFANRGSGNAGRFDYKVYLSTNSSITSSDTELALSGVGSGSLSGGLRAGSSDSERDVGFTLPSDLGSGNYYIGVLADTDRDVSESNENNNSDSERITVTAPTPSPSPDISVSVSDESAMEGETLRFTVALDRAPSETTTYYYATYRSSAGSNDYVGRVDSITFSPGESISQTIEVQTIADRLIDKNYEEQFYLYVTDAENKLPVGGTPEDSLGIGIGRIRDVDQDSIPQDNPSIIPPDNPDSIPPNIPSEPVSYRSSLDPANLEFALKGSLGPDLRDTWDGLYREGSGSVSVRFLGDYDYTWDAGFLLELGGGVGNYDLRYGFDVLPEISGSGTGIEFSTSDWETADALDLSFDGLSLKAEARLGAGFHLDKGDISLFDIDLWTEVDLFGAIPDIFESPLLNFDINVPDIDGVLQNRQENIPQSSPPNLVAMGSDRVLGLGLDLDYVGQQLTIGTPVDVLEYEFGSYIKATLLDVNLQGNINLVQEVQFNPEIRVDLYTPSGSLFQSKRLGDTFDLGSWGADDIKVEYTLGGSLAHRIGVQAEALLSIEYLKAKAEAGIFSFDANLGEDLEFSIAETNVFWLYEPDPSEIILGSRSYTYQLPSASSTPNPPSNGPPQISLQYFTVTEGTASVGRVIASDPEGGAVSYSLLSVGDYALFDITSEGVISFRVAPDYEAPRDSNNDNIYGVTVQVQDSAHQFSSAPVRISVNNEVSDDPQLAISTLAIAVQEGEQVTLTRQMIDVQLTNQQTNNAVVFHVQEVRHGTFFLNGRFTTTFTQADIISRAVVFRHDGSEQAPTFKIAVSMLGRDPVTYQDAEDITFTPINDAPRTKADYIQSAGGQVTIQVLENDVDPEGDSLEISRINDVSDGIATIDGQNIDYTPREGFVGNEEFTYDVRDDNGGISRGYVTVRVTGEPNTAPVAMDDSVSTEAGRQVKILVLNNDADVNQDPLEITGVSEAAHGTVSIVNNAYLRYRPDADFTGTETLTYSISDSQGGTDTGRVSIQVNPVDEPPVNPPEPVSQNNAPVAIYDEFTIAEDIASVSLDVLENDYDVDDGDTLSLMRAMADSGEASVRDNRIFYTPLADYDGNVRITYQVSDGSSIAQGLALLRIRPVNDAPTPTSSSIREISTVPGESLQLDSVAGWFRDVDADISAYSIHTGALPSGLSLNPSTGKWIGSISPHQQTTQYEFTVRATDSAGTYADQTVRISARDALLLYTSGSTGSDVMVVGSSLEAVANGGAGADHYVIPSGMFGNIRIIDQFGDNTLAFDQGVEIASVQQDFSILTVTLTDDNTIQISRPEGYTYALGSEAGLSLSQFMGRVDTGFFVTDLVAVPTTPESPADALQIYLNGNPNTDAFTLGFNQEARANGGAGADVYSISRFQKGNVEIEDLFGNNLIHFESGVQITETGLNLGTARLTLSTGAVVTVRDATTQKYQAGDGSVMTHAEFQAWVADSGTVPTSILIRGTAANNNLTGADQAEILYGFAGNDVLNGGGGSDVLNGGLGDDSLTGGSGSDSFVYGIRHTGREWDGLDGEDTILDFSIADNDKLKLLDARGLVSSIAHLEQGYDDAQYQVRVRDADLMLVAFANVRQSENGATGSNQLKITLTENIDTSLYDANTGRFNDFDAFVDALGGDDSILFA